MTGFRTGWLHANSDIIEVASKMQAKALYRHRRRHGCCAGMDVPELGNDRLAEAVITREKGSARDPITNGAPLTRSVLFICMRAAHKLCAEPMMRSYIGIADGMPVARVLARRYSK